VWSKSFAFLIVNQSCKERVLIAVVDYGAGNLASVVNALERIGAPVTVTRDAQEIYAADGVIVPGVGAAVIDHPDNPESTWHNVSHIGLLNPAIVGAGEIQLPEDKPFTLQYRAVTFDGPVPTSLLNRLATEWGH
jgi:hypothetical protein